ncbi:IclR family transcriptional regulator [Brevibacillus ruminantium]|uniref:IclR family transcriptional regulator n=1 Tax=Brevibacillus ruminantium TaxID=2950604 RepID=A0ABY4WAY5_9BACL|nr:IclR family transcriptional regulator [Brevibacillus ruminantium]USG64341.1 IclR family transcriptional regulator [Brevibacillus ruminantium]
MTTPKSSTTIQSLQIGCDILELVASHEKPLKFNEIHELSQITKSNLYKYLNTLTQVGMLHRDKENGLYSLGSKLIEYGMKAVNQGDTIERVTPYLQEINRICKNTVLLTMWTHNGPVVVKLINSQPGLNIGAQIGTFLPITSSAGKVYAAFQEELVMAEWKKEQLAKLSEVQKEQLASNLAFVREHQISFANEPLVPTISSIGLPIFNFEKRLLGAIVVVGFDDAIPKSIDDIMSQYLLKMMNEISQVFGYKP